MLLTQVRGDLVRSKCTVSLDWWRWRQSEKQQVKQEEGKQGKSEYYQIKTGSFHVSVINTDNPTKETRQRGQRETLGTLDAQQRNNKSEIETKTHINNIQKPRTMTGISPKRKMNLLCVTTITTASPQFPVIQLSSKCPCSCFYYYRINNPAFLIYISTPIRGFWCWELLVLCWKKGKWLIMEADCFLSKSSNKTT